MKTDAIEKSIKLSWYMGGEQKKAEAQLSAILARLAEAEMVIAPFALAGDKLLDMTIGERTHFHPDDCVSRINLEMAAMWKRKKSK